MYCSKIVACFQMNTDQNNSMGLIISKVIKTVFKQYLPQPPFLQVQDPFQQQQVFFVA